MRIPQAADILDVSESTMREFCRKGLVLAVRKPVPLKFFLRNKNGTVSQVKRLGSVWEINAPSIRARKKLRNRG